MNFDKRRHITPLRVVLGFGLLAGSLFVPASVGAAAGPTGTVTGQVTCGPSEEAPAVNAVVDIQGMNLSVRTDANGSFTLTNVPAAQSVTLDAVAGPTSFITSRYNLVVQPGETLNIGSLDLGVCPQPTQQAIPTENLQPQEQVAPDFAEHVE